MSALPLRERLGPLVERDYRLLSSATTITNPATRLPRRLQRQRVLAVASLVQGGAQAATAGLVLSGVRRTRCSPACRPSTAWAAASCCRPRSGSCPRP